MRNNSAAQDARLILQLVRLREESEMRKARRWWADEFWPRTAPDYLKIETAHGSQQNKWLRQVATYWGMAASFVLDGTLSEKAFLRPDFSGEMFTIGTDFERGSFPELVASITERLWPLGDNVQFVPGHGPMSTFGAERRTNPFVADAVLAGS